MKKRTEFKPGDVVTWGAEYYAERVVSVNTRCIRTTDGAGEPTVLWLRRDAPRKVRCKPGPVPKRLRKTRGDR